MSHHSKRKRKQNDSEGATVKRSKDEEDIKYDVPMAYPQNLLPPEVDFLSTDYLGYMLSKDKSEGIEMDTAQLNMQQARDAMMLLPIPKPWSLGQPYAGHVLGRFKRFKIKQEQLAAWGTLVRDTPKPFKVKDHVFVRLPKSVRGLLPRQRKNDHHYGEATLCTMYREDASGIERMVVKPSVGDTQLKPALIFPPEEKQEYIRCLLHAKKIHNVTMQHMYQAGPGLFGVQ